MHRKEARIDNCLFSSAILYLCVYIYSYICMYKLYIHTRMFVHMNIFCMCVHINAYMYKSQSFSCRNYFCEVNVIAKDVS